MPARKKLSWKDRGRTSQARGRTTLGRPSPIVAYQEFVQRSITAATIMSNLVTVGEGSSLERARKVMERKNFDCLGVKDRSGRPVGFITLDETKGRGACGRRKRLFAEAGLIAESTPLIGVMHEFAESPRRFLFVLGGREVTGIITLADLQKPVARVFMFGLITMLESGMTDCLRRAGLVTEKDMLHHLSAGRIENARKQYENRQREKLEIDFVECLQFSDKADLLSKVVPLPTLKEWAFVSKNSWKRFMVRVQGLRNHLAHSNSELVKPEEWPETIYLLERVEQLIGQLESTTHQ